MIRVHESLDMPQELTMAAKDNEDRKTDEQDADLSLDMSQAAVKKMIAEARERGS